MKKIILAALRGIALIALGYAFTVLLIIHGFVKRKMAHADG
jgi:hypothetical protein